MPLHTRAPFSGLVCEASRVCQHPDATSFEGVGSVTSLLVALPEDLASRARALYGPMA
jgi:hypothetical protein